MAGIQISESGTYVSNEYIKPCVDGIFQVFKEHLPEFMQTTEIITVILKDHPRTCGENPLKKATKLQ